MEPSKWSDVPTDDPSFVLCPTSLCHKARAYRATDYLAQTIYRFPRLFDSHCLIDRGDEAGTLLP